MLCLTHSGPRWLWLWRDKKNLDIHVPATSDEVFSSTIFSHFFYIMIMIMCTMFYFLEMGKVLDNLKKVNPLLEHIKLAKKKLEAFPDL